MNGRCGLAWTTCRTLPKPLCLKAAAVLGYARRRITETRLSGQSSDPKPQASDRTLLQLATAQRRAQYAIFWERLWPNLARLLTVAGLFLVVSWAGLWLALPPTGRAVGLALFAVLAIAASVPLIWLRWPGRAEALTRLDRGSGVPQDERETIFTPFYRLKGSGPGGTGLGLALVRAIATAHGGSVVCLPRDGGGSVFRVKLPAAGVTAALPARY